MAKIPGQQGDKPTLIELCNQRIKRLEDSTSESFSACEARIESSVGEIQILKTHLAKHDDLLEVQHKRFELVDIQL